MNGVGGELIARVHSEDGEGDEGMKYVGVRKQGMAGKRDARKEDERFVLESRDARKYAWQKDIQLKGSEWACRGEACR